jgi:hypothetical protein
MFLEPTNVDIREVAHDTDVEMGLLEENASPTPTAHEDRFENHLPLIPALHAANHRRNVLKVFGEALVVYLEAAVSA